MSSVAVFVFLLDNLTGFNHALNETLINSAKFAHSNETPVVQNCDPFTTDQILSAVSQELDLVMVPNFGHHNNHLNNENYEDAVKEHSTEIFNTVFDNSLHETENARDTYKIPSNFNVFDNDLDSFYRRNYDHESLSVYEEVIPEPHITNDTKSVFPKNAPFLVAIFETLANVTAQTCAGTVLNPRWVLTAANCINILSNMYGNSTNITETSHYTIVAGSANPLLDGTAHNVTAVLIQPSSNSSNLTSEAVEIEGPYLALMKIEPEIEGPSVELMEGELHEGAVMVYGWILSKNETEHDTLNSTSMFGAVLSPAECQTMYSYKNSDVICLHSNDNDKNVTQLSSGGPVLAFHEHKVKLLAVVQTDEHVFISYPIAGHYDWIMHTIN